MYKSNRSFVNGLGRTSILQKNGFFASKSKEYARCSGDDESIPDKRQCSPMRPHFILDQNDVYSCIFV